MSSYYSNSYKVLDGEVYSYLDDFELDQIADPSQQRRVETSYELEANFVDERMSPVMSYPGAPSVLGEIGYVNGGESPRLVDSQVVPPVYGGVATSYVNATTPPLPSSSRGSPYNYIQGAEGGNVSYTTDEQFNQQETKQKPVVAMPQFVAVGGSGSSIDIVSQLNRYTTRDFKRKDWNSEFQSILSLPNSEQKFSKLSHLARDFVFTAKSYAQIIINELCVPLEQKTIKPIDVGGFAGGLKYHCHNILFKFAMDTMLSKDCWMYGGKVPRDDYAAKAASNELKGLTSYYMAGVEGLNYPLMALIDYKGFRLIALSVLPISSETIRYGSSDSGTIVHQSIDDLNKKMGEAGRKLNLKPHRVGSIPDYTKVLASPGDIEAHLGTDSRYYVIDFSRTFPPESLTKQPNINKRCIFYNLLRPEFVSKWRKPLCSDSFSGWQRFDPDKHLHNKEVEEATLYLINNQVKSLANKLDGSDFFKSKYERTKGDNNENKNENTNDKNENDNSNKSSNVMTKGTMIASEVATIANEKQTKIIQGPSDFNQIKSTFATKFFPIFQKRYMDSDLPLPPSIMVKEDTRLINSSVDSTSSTNSGQQNGAANNSGSGNGNGNSGAANVPLKTKPMNQVKNDSQQHLLKIVEEMHRMGINIRHMGRVRYYTKSKTIRELLLLEMAARSIKTIIRDEMRVTMKVEQGLSEEPFKQIFIQIFNQVLDIESSIWKRIYESIKSKYFMVFMKYDETNEINLKLSSSTSTMLSKLNIIDDASISGGTQKLIEEEDESSWKEQLSIKNLLERLFILTGVSLSTVAQYEFSKDYYRFQFVESDIQEIYANVKHMNIIDYAEGMALSMASKSKQGRERLRLLKMSSLKFQTSLKSNPDNFECLYQLGRTLVAQAESIQATTGIFGKNIFLKTLEDAVVKFQYALGIQPTYSRAHYELAHVYILLANHYHNNYKKSQSNYQLAAVNFRKAIETSINIFTLQQKDPQQISELIFNDIERLYKVGEEGNYSSYVMGVTCLCKELESLYRDDYRLILIYGKSLIYQPYIDDDTRIEIYSQAASKFYSSIQLNPKSKEDVFELAHDLWVKSKVGNRKLFYPTYIVLRLLVRNNFCTDDNKIYAMYSDSMIEILKMDSENYQLYLEELSELFDVLCQKSSPYFLDRLELALTNQLVDISNFIKIANNSSTIRDRLRLEAQKRKTVSLNLQKTLISNEDLDTLGTIYPNLEELNLSSCPMINDQPLSEFISNHGRSILVLKLSGTLIADKTISVISNYCNNLSHLDVQNCPFIDPESFLELYKLPKLKKLDLSKCKLTNEVIQTFQNSQLTEFSIRYQRINDSAFKLFHTPWTTLRVLDLSSCSVLSDNSFTKIPHCPHMEQLLLEACYNLTDQTIISIANNMPKLNKLSMKGCKFINDTAIHYLVSRCTLIRDLKLSRCQSLTGDAIHSIVEFLSQVLESIDISLCTQIPETSIQYLVQNIKSFLSINLSEITSVTDATISLIMDRHPNLQHLKIDRCHKVTFTYVDISQQSSTLQTLSFKKSQIFNQSLISLATNLKKLSHLTLQSCLQLTDQSFSYLSHLTSLEYLDLSGNPVLHDASMISICKALVSLKTLDISRCPRLTTKSFHNIGKHQTKIETLGLSACDNLDDTALIYILEHLLNLQHLDVSSNFGITDKSLYCLARYQIQLETISLTDCKNVHLFCVDQIKTNCPLFKLAKVSIHSLPSALNPKEILKPIPYQETLKALEWKIKGQEKKVQEQTEKEKKEKEKEIVIEYQDFSEKVQFSLLISLQKPQNLNPLFLEKYLSEIEFKEKFLMSPESFEQLPKWKKDHIKKSLHLF